MKEYRSLNHKRWDCKYHVVCIPMVRNVRAMSCSLPAALAGQGDALAPKALYLRRTSLVGVLRGQHQIGVLSETLRSRSAITVNYKSRHFMGALPARITLKCPSYPT